MTNDPLFDKLWAFQDLANEADINWQEGGEKYLNDSQNSNTTVIVAVIAHIVGSEATEKGN